MSDDSESMDPIQARGFVWFELLVSASYLGTATNLAERVVARGTDEARASLTIELETMAAALEQVASAATGDDNDALLARALYARFATERTIERVIMSAAATLAACRSSSRPRSPTCWAPPALWPSTHPPAPPPQARSLAISPTARSPCDAYNQGMGNGSADRMRYQGRPSELG